MSLGNGIERIGRRGFARQGEVKEDCYLPVLFS